MPPPDGADPTALQTLREDQNGSTVTLAVGQTVMTSLNQNASTGYSWAIVQAPDTGVVVQVDAPADPDHKPANMPGAPGPDYRLAFKALTPGTTSVKLLYRQPWEGGGQGTAFSYTIKVTNSPH